MKLNQETFIQEVKVKIRAKVNLTENQLKVENSIINLVKEKPIIKVTEDNYILVEGDLNLLSNIKSRIIKNEQEEVLCNILEKNKEDYSLKFFINKQSALNNNLHLIDESMSTLGDIEVEIISNDLPGVINWFKS